MSDKQKLEAKVFCVPMSSPGDVSQVAALFDRKAVDPAHVVAIMAQTEGDPYARGYATLAMEVLLSERLGLSRQEVFAKIPMMMIGGVGGIMSPHIYLFIKQPGGAPAQGKRLALGVASSRELKPEEYGTMVQVDLVAETVRQAMRDAGITHPSQVECVEVKCPAMTPARIADAEKRNQKVVNTNPAVASSLAKGACALGVAVATGEVERGKLKDGVINVEKSLYSSVASTSAGGEQVACRVLVIGNVEGAPGHLMASHGVMTDQLDAGGARKAFSQAGLELRDGMVAETDRKRIAGVLVNAGADYVTNVRGRRHVLHSDFLAPFSGIQAKAVAHAVVASIVGDTMFLASAGAEHQGPPGANLICVIAEAKT
ncbi:MAG: ring-opening amidohydrolase [Hyphomonadaceae bacterium]|jgi:cyanuric acid amidohydrolase|nr:ring-opening amidohydrolase [Hyphomonadaceae bacterium]